MPPILSTSGASTCSSLAFSLILSLQLPATGVADAVREEQFERPRPQQQTNDALSCDQASTSATPPRRAQHAPLDWLRAAARDLEAENQRYAERLYCEIQALRESDFGTLIEAELENLDVRWLENGALGIEWFLPNARLVIALQKTSARSHWALVSIPPAVGDGSGFLAQADLGGIIRAALRLEA